MLWYLVFVAKTPMYPASSFTSSRWSLRVMRCCLWAWSSQEVCQIKQNCQLRLCFFFFFSQYYQSICREWAMSLLPALCWCKQAVGPQWNMREYGSIIQGEFRMKTWKLGQQHQRYTEQCRKGEPRPGPRVVGGRLAVQTNFQDHRIYPVGSGNLWVGV